MFDKSLINQAELFETDSVEFKKSNLQKALNKQSKEDVLKFYKDADEAIRSNITVCANVFKIAPLAINDAPESIKANKSLILRAISNDKKAIECIPKHLLEDEQIAMGIINIDPCMALEILSDSILQKDKVSNNLIRTLSYRSHYLRSHYLTNISKVIKRIFSSPLESVFSSHINYVPLINNLVCSHSQTYSLLPKKYQHNKDIILKTIRSNNKKTAFIKNLPENLTSDTSFCLAMLRAGAKPGSMPKTMWKEEWACRNAISVNVLSARHIPNSLWKDRELVIHFFTKLRSSQQIWNGNWTPTFEIINNFHLLNEDINEALASYGYEIKEEAHFLNSKRLVKVFLNNASCTYKLPFGRWKNGVVSQYKLISSKLKLDRDIASKAMQLDFRVYNHIDDSLKYDIKLFKRVVNAKPLVAARFNDKLKDDKELAICSISRSAVNYRHISQRLKNDKEIVKLATDKSATIYKDLPIKYRDDSKIALEAISRDPGNLKHTSPRLKDNKDFVESAILRGASLKYVSNNLKANKHIVRYAVNQYDSNLHFADKTIKEDKEFLLKYFPIHLVFRYCSFKILQDKEIFTAGVNLDIRLIERRGMTPAQMLKMNYEGIYVTERSKIFTYYKKHSKEKDIFLLAKAKSIICGSK